VSILKVNLSCKKYWSSGNQNITEKLDISKFSEKKFVSFHKNAPCKRRIAYQLDTGHTTEHYNIQKLNKTGKFENARS
jgi:hypothetical protein